MQKDTVQERAILPKYKMISNSSTFETTETSHESRKTLPLVQTSLGSEGIHILLNII